MVYGHANGNAIEETVERALEYPSKATRRSGCRAAFPASPRPTACPRTDISTSRPMPIFRPRICGRPRNTCAPCPSCSPQRARRSGWDVHLLHDVHHRLTPIEAARLGKDLEPYPPVLAGGRGRRGQSGKLPADPPAHDDAARGRRGLQQHLGRQAAHPGAADRLYPRDRGARRRDHAPAAHRQLSPTCSTSAPAATARPIFRRSPWRRRSTSICRCPISASRNICATPRRPTRFSRTRTVSRTARCIRANAPGLGVDIDEELAARYPYKRAYLPVNRLEDGTMFNW